MDVLKASIAMGAPVPLRALIIRMFVTPLYLGFGNPLGMEGPFLHAMAGLGSALLKFIGARYFPSFFRMEHNGTWILVGSCAALGCQFESALGGMIFAIEELLSVRKIGQEFILVGLGATVAAYTSMICTSFVNPLYDTEWRRNSILLDGSGRGVDFQAIGRLSRGAGELGLADGLRMEAAPVSVSGLSSSSSGSSGSSGSSVGSPDPSAYFASIGMPAGTTTAAAAAGAAILTSEVSVNPFRPYATSMLGSGGGLIASVYDAATAAVESSQHVPGSLTKLVAALRVKARAKASSSQSAAAEGNYNMHVSAPHMLKTNAVAQNLWGTTRARSGSASGRVAKLAERLRGPSRKATLNQFAHATHAAPGRRRRFLSGSNSSGGARGEVLLHEDDQESRGNRDRDRPRDVESGSHLAVPLGVQRGEGDS